MKPFEWKPKHPFLCFIMILGMVSGPSYAQDSFHHPHLWDVYGHSQISPDNPRRLTHKDLESLLRILDKKGGEDLDILPLGSSVEGRSISLITLGRGTTRVFLWSQMHGDEPTATNALLDILNYILEFRDEPFVKQILDSTKLLILPMLNPDGAVRHRRRNAIDIDINRDARDLVSPEAQILKKVRDEYVPEFGFNLHDQSTRRTVGKTDKLAAVALMAPPFDSFSNDNAVRLRAKKVAVVIMNSLSPYIYGHVSRYDAGYMPRSFGDSMQSWGTSTVLFETGGWYREDARFMVRLNFIGILTALHAIATGSYETANPAVYDGLPQNERSMFDLLITDATVYNGVSPFVFKGDIGINFRQSGQSGERIGFIDDIGDLDGFPGKDSLDASNQLVMPGFIHIVQGDGQQDVEVRNELLGDGITTLVEIRSTSKQARLLQDLQDTLAWKEGLNGAFLVEYDENADPDAFDISGTCLAKGALGLFIPGKRSALPTSAERLRSWFSCAVLKELPTTGSGPSRILTWDELKQMTSARSKTLRIPQRGRIARGYVADLLVFSTDEFTLSESGVRIGKPGSILVGGRRSRDTGGGVIHPLGRVLRRKRE